MAEVYGHTTHTVRMSTNLEAFQKIAENERLTKKDYRVFIFLSCRLESKHIRKIDVDQISHTLGLTKKEVKDSFTNLISEGIISEDSDQHVKKGYRMDYTKTGGKGTYDNR